MNVIPITERQVSVYVTKSGAWVVHDERDRCGGRFCDQATALRYIRREFGTRTRIVMIASAPRQAA